MQQSDVTPPLLVYEQNSETFSPPYFHGLLIMWKALPRILEGGSKRGAKRTVFQRSLCVCGTTDHHDKSLRSAPQNDRLTVVVGLVRVRHQPAVVGPRRHSVGDPVVVVVIVALVPLPVFVRVQLRAVDYERAIILGVLMAVAVAAGGEERERHVQRGVSKSQSRGRKCHQDMKGGAVTCLGLCRTSLQPGRCQCQTETRAKSWPRVSQQPESSLSI